MSLTGSDSKWVRAVNGRALPLEQRTKRDNSRCVNKRLCVRNKSTFFTYRLGIKLFLYHHHAVCLTTGPQPLPNRVLHSVRSRASSFNSNIFSSLTVNVFFLVFPSLLYFFQYSALEACPQARCDQSS